jgi:phosphoribosylglycinamide formyltransferase-1
MEINTVVLITYHFPHLKTEQVMERLLRTTDYTYRMYALPFKRRKERAVSVHHRPNQAEAVAPEVIADEHKIPYVVCETDGDVDSLCDIYLILGAGILSPECVSGKRIVNCHPGIIPASRGLDSFKWAIYEKKLLGVTLHYIDANVDAGEIITVASTNVYITDSLATLARRHYENEIDCLSRFSELLQTPVNPFAEIEEGEAKNRMPVETEVQMARLFSEYTEQYGQGRVSPFDG